jgi:predicted nucleic acid-binding protein
MFVDTNIFIFVYFSTINRDVLKVRHYQRHYAYLRLHDYELYTNYDVITEIVGVLMHHGYDQYRSTVSYSKYYDFKDFRDGIEGQSLLSATCDTIQSKILDHISILDKVFDINDIRRFVVPDNLDCTDKAIISICKQYDVILFTDDRDFRHTSIPLLTRNSTILSTAAPVIPPVSVNHQMNPSANANTQVNPQVNSLL